MHQEMKPPRTKRQERGDDSRGSSDTRPGNSARICLDGDGRDVVSSFQEGILHIFSWCRANGTVMDVSGIFGPGTEVVTTPLKGTFHLELEFNERVLEVVIRGRDLYVMGWRNPNGSFEIKEKPTDSKKKQKKQKKPEETKRNYLLGQDVRPVYIGFNHGDLAPGGKLKYTMMGIYEFRGAFDALFEYKGGSPSRSVREAVGKIAVFISESTRYPFVEDTVCRSLVDNRVSRLNQAHADVLMKHIDFVLAGLTPPPFRSRGLQIQSAADIVPMIRVLHIDAYSERKFAHDPWPEVMSEEPIDQPVQMDGGKNRVKEHCHTKSGKISNKQVKEAARGRAVSAASSQASTRRRYTTESVSCSSVSLDSWRQSVEEKNSACKSLMTPSRGFGGSTLSHLGAAPVPSSVHCSSTPPSGSQHDIWPQCEANNNVRKFLESLSRGCGRSALMHLAPYLTAVRIFQPCASYAGSTTR